MPNRPYVNTNPNDVTEYIVIVDGAGQAVNGDGGLIESYTPDGFKMKFFCFCDQYGNEYNAFVTSITPGDGLDSVVLPGGSTQVSLKPAQLAELGGLFAKTPIEGQYVVGLDESGNLIFESIGDIDLPGGSTGTGPIVLQNAPTINNPVIQVPQVYGGQWTGGVLNGMTSHNEIADSGSYTNSSMKGTKADGLMLTAPPGVTVVDGVTQHPGGGLDFWTASGIDFSSDSNHLLRSVLLDSWGLPKVSASATVPTLLTRRTDLTTGLGGPAGELDMIVNGVSQLKADATGLRNNAGEYIVTNRGMRNRLINGNMRIDQRNGNNGAGQILAANQPYGPVSIDRWRVGSIASCRTGFSQNKTIAGWWGKTFSEYFLNVWAIDVQANLAANDLGALTQPIEYINIADFQWGTPLAKPVTISFVIAVGAAGDYGIHLSNHDGSLNYVHKITLPANTVTPVSFTVLGPTTGSWAAGDNITGLFFRIVYAAGANKRTANLDAWSTGAGVAPMTQVNMYTVANQNLAITDVQLEIGTVATPFEHRAWAEELRLCQRYYYNSYSYGVVPGTVIANGACAMAGFSVNNIVCLKIQYPVKMRAGPTITSYSPATGAPGFWHDNNSGTDVSTGVMAGNDFGATIYTGQGSAPSAQIFGQVAADAEL